VLHSVHLSKVNASYIKTSN